jgi:general stress protein 26
MKSANGNKGFDTLKEKIKDVRFCMLTTEANGQLRSRPMGTADVKEDGVLWFFTAKNSGKAYGIARDAQVNLSYAEPEKQLYVSVSGQARLEDNKAKAHELWNPMLKAWFPQGLDDPNLTMLRVDVEQAEYWDGPSNKMVQLFEMVRAAVTGEYDKGENEKIKMTPNVR